MNAKNVNKVTVDGVPTLQFTLNGRGVVIAKSNQKVNLLEKYGVVFLGAEFEDDYTVELEADPDVGMPKTILFGYTDHPKIVAICREFLLQ